MPYEIKNKDGRYQVRGPSGIHARGTTKEKAEAQVRLLRAKEHNPDFGRKPKPRGGK